MFRIPHTFILFTLLAASPSWAAPEDEPVYSGVVQKIFDKTCLSCHQGDRKKGKLDMSTMELMFQGGSSEKPGLTPGDLAASEIFARMALPHDHDDHMPPENKPQPTEQEVAIVKWWIEAGAKTDTLIKDAAVPEELKSVVLELAAATVEKPQVEAVPVIAPKDLDAATKEAISAISNELGVTILQLSQSDLGLMFTAVNVSDKFDDAALAKLAPVMPHLVDVNLARTKVSDAGLSSLAAAVNLQRLRLENTGITDAGLEHLKGLSKLEYLNLFNTAVTDSGLNTLTSLPNLKRLYAWQSQVTKEGAEKLHAANTAVVINLGWDTEIGRPAAPPPPAPAPEPEPVKEGPIDPEASFFTSRIEPMLDRTCYSCHGAEKKRGGFDAHTFDALVKGGNDAGSGIVAGKPEESSVLARIVLPADHDEKMPPEGKPQPTEKEVALLKFWIEQGADAAKKNKDYQLPAELTP